MASAVARPIRNWSKVFTSSIRGSLPLGLVHRASPSCCQVVASSLAGVALPSRRHSPAAGRHRWGGSEGEGFLPPPKWSVDARPLAAAVVLVVTASFRPADVDAQLLGRAEDVLVELPHLDLGA